MTRRHVHPNHDRNGYRGVGGGGGRGEIVWEQVGVGQRNALRADTLGTTPLVGNIATLTKSGHIALGVSTHVGRCIRVREWAFVVETFLKTEAFK